MQKHYRGNTVLIELLIVILFFALSAVIAMGLFVTAQERSVESARVTQALVGAQDAAERLVGRTDWAKALTEAGFVETNGTYARLTEDGLEYRVTLAEAAYGAGTLYTATVTALADEKTLLTIPVGYYKEAAP